MKRLDYKKQTAILFEFIEHLVEAGQQLYGEANQAGVDFDAPGSVAWRNETSLVQLGVLSRPDLQELAVEYKCQRAAT